jgi:hypothetical protein
MREEREMKKIILSSALMVMGVAVFTACVSMQSWPDQERNAENKMVVIQEEIGDGLKTGALSPDQSQMFLTTLKGIRTDYSALRDRRVYRDEWDILHRRLDTLGDEIRRALTRTTRVEEPRSGERIVALQRRIDARLFAHDGRRAILRSRGEDRDFPQARYIGSGLEPVPVAAKAGRKKGGKLCR